MKKKHFISLISTIKDSLSAHKNADWSDRKVIEIVAENIKTDEEEKNNLARLNPVIVEKAKSIFEKSRSDTDGFPYGGVIQDYKSMDRFEK